jgi:hypothetical protein
MASIGAAQRSLPGIEFRRLDLEASAVVKPSQALALHRREIRELVEQNRARNPRIFGSVLYGRDTETSDLDVLVDPIPGTTLLDLGGLQVMLEELLGVQVDLLTPGDLSRRARDRVLSEAAPI